MERLVDFGLICDACPFHLLSFDAEKGLRINNNEKKSFQCYEISKDSILNHTRYMKKQNYIQEAKRRKERKNHNKRTIESQKS